MIFQTDIEAAVERSLPGKFEKRDLLALGAEFNRLHEREMKESVRDAYACADRKVYKWKALCVVGYLVALGLLLAFSLLGL